MEEHVVSQISIKAVCRIIDTYVCGDGELSGGTELRVDE